LLITINGKPAAEQVSRGQQKVLVTTLLLTQAGLFNERTGKHCLLLIDDVAAELDQVHRKRLMQVLAEMDVQLFVTVIEPDTLLTDLSMEMKVFHVEHGKVKEMV
jgi:DNA replication and repair protein RecF